MEDSETSRKPGPSWLIADQCPAWCERRHPVGELREDQAHRAPPLRFPVMTASGPPYLHAAPRPDTFLIDIRRFRGADETWVYVGSEARTQLGCELTLESAMRLQRYLARALGIVRGPFHSPGTDLLGWQPNP